MDWLAIIQMIIAIATALLQALNGLNLTKPKPEGFTNRARAQYECSDPYWAELPKVKHGRFSGVMALECDFTGTAGTGLASLKEHLAGNLAEASKSVESEKSVVNEGYTTQTFLHTSEVSIDDGKQDIRGKSTYSTDGVSELNSTYETVWVPNKGSLQYLNGTNQEVQIIPNGDGSHFVRILYGSEIDKPGIISDDAFRAEMIQQSEMSIKDKTSDILTDLASHL